MANIKISELDELVNVADNDYLPIVDTSENETKKVAIQRIGAGGKSGDTLPIGSIVSYGNETAPANWLICDGSAVSRTAYADLFAVIGTKYGKGDGSTTFNLPNLKGRVPVGLDSSDTDFNTIGKTGGEKTHTLTIQEIPAHNHLLGLSGGGTETNAGLNYQQSSTWRYYDGNDISGFAGGGQSHNNLQPYEVNNFIIKAFQSAGVVAQVSNTKSTSTTDTYSCDYVNRFGKLLWQGSFTEGSINVEGSTNYYTFIVEVLGTVRCLGSRSYGGSTIGTYGSYAQETYTYRVGGVGDTWTIDSTNKGGSNGTSNVAITAIYGLF